VRLAGHALAVVLLSLLTQLGGLAWLTALAFRRRFLAFTLLYGALWGAAILAAPTFGRVALPCFGAPLRMQSAFYCITMRSFVAPEMAALAEDAAERVAETFPGTVTLALDGGFPLPIGLPMLPHLSHGDGRKLDFAFFYADPSGRYLPGQTRSPLGYFAFEHAGAAPCPPAWPTLRWDFAWLQPLLPDRPLEPDRSRALIAALTADPRTGKLFVEPPLAGRLGLSDPKLRFQGCRAARHDDHLHVQL
jgi:hypothetical protein